jgi:hypothetical protein
MDAGNLAPLLGLGFWLLLCRFRKEVRRSLEAAGAKRRPPVTPRVPSGPFPALRVLQAAPPTCGLRQATRRLHIQLGCYFSAVLASAALLTQATLLHEHPGWRLRLVVFLGFVWPLGPMMAVLIKARRRTVLLGAGVLFAVLGLAVWQAGAMHGFMAFHVVVGLVLCPLLVWRVRGSAPWVFLALAVVPVARASMSHPDFHGAPHWLATVVAGGDARRAILVALLVLVLSVALAGVLFWRAAPWLVRVYEALRLNDRSLALGFFWLSYCALSAAAIVNVSRASAPWWVEASIAGSSVLPIAAAVLAGLGLGRWSGSDPGAREPRVLHLRSFQATRGAELFEELQPLLLNVAGLDLIAGPDLATSVARLQELMDFIGQGAGRKYLHDVAAFEARRQALDRRLDIERRHRVHEYYCGNDVWVEVFRRLAADADAVLIDVRGLTGPDSGIAYELTELIRWVPLEKVVVVTDRARPPELLETVARRAWDALPDGSPNASAHPPAPSIFEIDPGKASEAERLVGHLCAILEKPRVRAAARSGTIGYLRPRIRSWS